MQDDTIPRELTRAVVLAAGRGTRMRAAGSRSVPLDADQERAADRGLKGMIPFGDEPFLAHVLTALADAGYTDACLVVGPGADPIRAHFEQAPARRLRIRFAVQETPLGSAHALLAAEAFSGGGDIAVINSDNHYPAPALRALRALKGSGLVGFRRDGLLSGNVAADRIAGYALIERDGRDMLTSIREKPDAESLAEAGARALVSMTCWRFRSTIFEAIRRTPRSVRGEYELPDAVRLAMQDERFEVVPMSVPVLDLSRRDDIPRVGAMLRGRSVRL
jgi:dTDP-glucose pyrophosphorylase